MKGKEGRKVYFLGLYCLLVAYAISIVTSLLTWRVSPAFVVGFSLAGYMSAWLIEKELPLSPPLPIVMLFAVFIVVVPVYMPLALAGATIDLTLPVLVLTGFMFVAWFLVGTVCYYD